MHLTDDELRVTKPNSRIEIYETYRKDNPINRSIQVFYMDKQRSKKKSIPVALVRGLWHRIEINRQERTTILAEPLPSIHDFDFEIRTDQQTLDLGSIADALPTPTELTTTVTAGVRRDTSSVKVFASKAVARLPLMGFLWI